MQIARHRRSVFRPARFRGNVLSLPLFLSLSLSLSLSFLAKTASHISNNFVSGCISSREIESPAPSKGAVEEEGAATNRSCSPIELHRLRDVNQTSHLGVSEAPRVKGRDA